jgi:hypothetical protein
MVLSTPETRALQFIKTTTRKLQNKHTLTNQIIIIMVSIYLVGVFFIHSSMEKKAY